MGNTPEVRITGVEGQCPCGHKEGDIFHVTSMNHDCLCGSLYQSIHPHIVTQEYNGQVPWEKENGTFMAACPEKGKVQVEVKRFENSDPDPMDDES